MTVTIVVALVLLVAAAACLATAIVLTRRAPPVEAPPPALAEVEDLAPPATPPPPLPPRDQRLPIVLVHGLFGFDRLAGFEYFRGIARHLASLGCAVEVVRLPPTKSIPERAAALVAALGELGRADVIAHSLGGLDARYAIAKLGLGDRVRTLVTIGTPHHGSEIADLVVDGALARARAIVRALGIPLDALDWLSTAALARFNADVRDVPGVRYASVVGGVRSPKTAVALPLVAPHRYLRKVAGANDGLVSIASQRWGEVLAEIEADHFSQIGWRTSVRRTFDALGLYAFIASRLAARPGDRSPAVAPQ